MSKELMRKYTLETPDPKEYEHLSQKERMLAGYPYHPGDPQLREERTKARALVKQFNDSSDKQVRSAILDDLLNPACRGNGAFIDPPFHVDYGCNITIGKNFGANFNCVFLDCAPITIGDFVMIAPNVQIYAATHPLNPKYRSESKDYFELAYPVTIGNKVWIGGNAVICPGVTIGDNSVIGAGSVVTKDVPANVVVAGNPAKIIRTLDFEN